MRRWIFGCSAIVATTALVMACSVGTDCDFGLCAGPAAGGDGGSGGETGADQDSMGTVDATPPGCDPTKELNGQDACLNDAFAVFVSLNGKPENPGTKSAPVNTLKKALELTGGMRQRVFVCDGTYAERVKLTSPVSIYGGLSCDGGNWKSSSGHGTFGNSQESGLALDVTNIAGPFELVDLEFDAAAGTASAHNSIAARVVGTPALTLKRVKLSAASGAAGDPGASGSTGVRSPTDGKGGTGNVGTGAGPNACTCTVGGPTTGGAGGGATNGMGSPGTGDAPPSGLTDGAGGAGGSASCATGLGHEGASAIARSPAAAPTSLGAVINADWAAARGSDGLPGLSGQGGGGGGANSGGGGAGGCGGCGGTGGKGGEGGGASIGLLAINAPIVLIACKVTTMTGGKGGKGGLAGTGGDPGFAGGGGTPAAGANGCQGGPGGRGGDGGHGSGGPGGLAAGIAFQGGAPRPDPATTTDQTGDAAMGGDPAAAGANAGPVGKKVPVQDLSAL